MIIMAHNHSETDAVVAVVERLLVDVRERTPLLRQRARQSPRWIALRQRLLVYRTSSRPRVW